MYHSSALLMPDGSVLISGSNPNTQMTYDGAFPTQFQTQLFFPHYLTWNVQRNSLTAVRDSAVATKFIGQEPCFCCPKHSSRTIIPFPSGYPVKGTASAVLTLLHGALSPPPHPHPFHLFPLPLPLLVQVPYTIAVGQTDIQVSFTTTITTPDGLSDSDRYRVVLVNPGFSTHSERHGMRNVFLQVTNVQVRSGLKRHESRVDGLSSWNWHWKWCSPHAGSTQSVGHIA